MEDSGHLAEETGYLLRDHFDAERAAPSSPNSASTPLRTYSGLDAKLCRSIAIVELLVVVAI